MTLGKPFPSLFRLGFQTSYIFPKLFMRFAQRYKFARYQYVSRAFPHLAHARGRANDILFRKYHCPTPFAWFAGMFACTRESALYIYIRKPSVCWIFMTDCPVKRLCSSNILERGCSGETWAYSCSPADAAENSFLLHRVYGVHYRLRNKSRNRYRGDSPT